MPNRDPAEENSVTSQSHGTGAPAGGGRRKVLALLPMLASNLLALERSFQYSIAAQRMGQGKPWGEPFVLSSEMIFQGRRRGDRRFVNSVRLGANQEVEGLVEWWIAFGEGAGVERVWLVWSREALAEAGRMSGRRQPAAERD
jgi:hypothetical protein